MSQQSSMPQKPNLPDNSFIAVINRSTTSTSGCHIPKGNKDDDQGGKEKTKQKRKTELGPRDVNWIWKGGWGSQQSSQEKVTICNHTVKSKLRSVIMFQEGSNLRKTF